MLKYAYIPMDVYRDHAWSEGKLEKYKGIQLTPWNEVEFKVSSVPIYNNALAKAIYE